MIMRILPVKATKCKTENREWKENKHLFILNISPILYHLTQGRIGK